MRKALTRVLGTLIFCYGYSLPAQAKSRIAFLSQTDSRGNIVQYEPGGRFVHTAIQFVGSGDQWLNAHPDGGVSLISWEELQQHGEIVDIVEIPQNIKLSQVEPYLGRPFDYWYSWSDEALYCTELIGKLLQVPTHPMRFNRQVWPKNYWPLEGKPGLSPDQLWLWAKQQSK